MAKPTEVSSKAAPAAAKLRRRLSRHAIGLELAAGRLVLVPVVRLPVVRNWNLVHRTEKRLSPAALAFKRFVLVEGSAFLAGWPGSGKP